MIKAVIDTNVLVSGLICEFGYSAKIVNAFKDKRYIMFFCNDMIAEYRDVLSRERLGLKTKDVDDLLDSILLCGLSVIPDVSDITLPDEDDRCFYDTAKTAGAYLVTGNKKHYPNESFIVTPADFVKLLNE